MYKIFLTSDLHFWHDKNFIWEARGFSSIEEMNYKIIANWNSIVGPEDEVYILGDLMLGNNEFGLECLRLLNGNIHIIIGNHDNSIRIKEYCKLPNIREVTYSSMIKYHKYHFYLSHYPTLTSNLDADKPLTKRIINLCGHTHTKDPYENFHLGLIYNVGMDAHNCYPILLDKVIENIKNKVEKMAEV
jgi:calcineurin-like phosphoesterase family protein